MNSWLYVAILVVSGLWLWLHHKSAITSEKAHQRATFIKEHPQKYHGTSIHPCAKACENVKNLHDKRFLASEVTSLPVFGCTTKQCSCSYVHHKDRRSGEDRRFPSIAMDGIYSNREHRTSKKDRRQPSFA
ncbi:MAG: hypothetical protein ACKE9I_07280 [Methylophagaceae bacterium]